MAKQLKDILKGVQASKLSKGSLGKDPGVDYQPKAGDEARFADKHMVQKHENRAGNKDDIFNATNVKYALDDKKKEPRHGRKKGDDQDVYEAREAEDVKCNESKKGVRCPVHGLAECWSAKKINEADDDEDFVVSRVKDIRSKMNATDDPSEKERYKKQHDAILSTVNRIPSNVKEEVEIDEASGEKVIDNGHSPVTFDQQIHASKIIKNKTGRKVYFDGGDLVDHKSDKTILSRALDRHPIHKLVQAASEFKEEVELDEVLTKKTPAAKWIRDFVDSDNPQFEGKSKKKRMQMALAAYYSKQREKKN